MATLSDAQIAQLLQDRERSDHHQRLAAQRQDEELARQLSQQYLTEKQQQPPQPSPKGDQLLIQMGQKV
jgi:hypothetical protein